MNIKEINVPKGIRYLSDWEEFKIPNHPCIIDKQIPGCGFTEYCLTNNENIILACPRKILLENKYDQHPGEVLLIKSYYQELNFDKSLASPKRMPPVDPKKVFAEKAKEEEECLKNLGLIKKDIINYWYLRQSLNKPAKILVTYDSFRKVKEILLGAGIFEDFKVVVDEFQSIFVDSRFKSDTETEFIFSLGGINNLCYVSATPMIEEYLNQMDEFKDLPYFRLNWSAEDPGRILKPSLKIRILDSPNSAVKKIVNSYLSGNFERSARINEKGESEIVESREAVIYVNSVNNIVNMIKACGLTPDQVNILCANTADNQARITRVIGKKFVIGKVPLKGEPRKMFTFCTRTIYLGADMYSDNARTFVISDANIDSMAVDITLDLPQILGRQRLESNPWKNKATVYVRAILHNNKMALAEFENMIKVKIERTESLLRSYESTVTATDKHTLTQAYEKLAMTFKYCDDYVAVNHHAGSDIIPVMNQLALLSERRAYDIQQVDYADRFSVFNRLNQMFSITEPEIEREIDEFKLKFENLETTYGKMKLLCTTELSDPARNQILDCIPEYFKKFYIALGPDRCKACGYDYSKMKRELDIKIYSNDEVEVAIKREFHVGDRISYKDAKEKLRELYNKINYKKTPKAVDLEQWFVLKETKIISGDDGKKVKAFEIIKKKELGED